jgi:hypothetical protein
MLYTLAHVRERLWNYMDSSVSYVDANNDQKSKADFRINQVVERFLTEGKWKGTLRRVAVDIHDGYITLPRELGTILGVEYVTESGCCCHSTIYSKFHEFAQGVACCSCGTYPITETAQTFITPSAGFKFRVKSTVTSGTISFYGGWDTSDEEYFGAETLNITNGTVTGTREYNSMPPTGGIQKEVTTVPVELYSVDSSGTETLIAVYAPNEQVPSYKRYRIPEPNTQFSYALVFGKLAYVEATQDSDIIIPSNYGALKIGLKALQSEDTEEDESAQKDWQRAYNILNNEVAEAEGDSELPVFRVSAEYGCDGIPNLV